MENNQKSSLEGCTRMHLPSLASKHTHPAMGICSSPQLGPLCWPWGWCRDTSFCSLHPLSDMHTQGKLGQENFPTAQGSVFLQDSQSISMCIKVWEVLQCALKQVAMDLILSHGVLSCVLSKLIRTPDIPPQAFSYIWAFVHLPAIPFLPSSQSTLPG